MPAATSGARRTWPRSWATSTRCGTSCGGGSRGRAPARPPGRLPLAQPRSPGRPGLQPLRGHQRPRQVRGPGRRNARADRRALHRLPHLAHDRLPPEARRQHAARGGRPAGPGIHPGAGQQDRRRSFPLPAIVKPSAEDASVGIDNGAVCTSKRALKKRVALMLEQFEEVLVQEYVPRPRVQRRLRRPADAADRRDPVRRDARRALAHRELRRQVDPGQRRRTRAPSPSARLTSRPTWPSGSARWRAQAWTRMSGAEGYGRVDLRVRRGGPALRPRGEPRAPTCRATPVSPGWAAPSAGATTTSSCRSWTRRSCARRATAPRRPWSAGCQPRERHDHPAAAPTPHRGRPRPHRGDQPCGRRVPRGRDPDRARGVRRRGRGPASAGSPDYLALGAEHDGRLAGWICWGPTPCTLGTFDLYWMAVDPAHHGRGHRHRSACAPWSSASRARARLIVVETAGRAGLRPDPRLLRGAAGTAAVSRIPDFYAPGDDQVVYVKYLALRFGLKEDG